MKIGVIGRADPTGLGSLTVDFCRGMHSYIDRAIIMDRSSRGETDLSQIHPDIQIKCLKEISDENIIEFFDGIDAVVGFECWYNNNVMPLAARHQVRTIIFPMWECSPINIGASDIIFNLSDTDQKWYPWGTRVDWPMGDWDLSPREVHMPPWRFVCNGGSGGLNNRNNVDAVEAAWHAGALRGTNADLVIRSHLHDCTSVVVGNNGKLIKAAGPERCREKIYDRADVIIHFQGHDGLALPLLEASFCRIPTLVLDIDGYKHYPKSMRIACPRFDDHKIGDMQVRYWRPSVEHLAEVINELATGKRIPAMPPEPTTWEDFENVWLKTLEAATI